MGELPPTIDTEPQYALTPWNNSTSSFRLELEAPLHNTVHRWVGGDMMTDMSPNDPVFFLHHANIDRIWFNWQRRWGFDRYAPGDGESDDLNMHRFSDNLHAHFGIQVRPRDILSPHELPAAIRYDYVV